MNVAELLEQLAPGVAVRADVDGLLADGAAEARADGTCDVVRLADDGSVPPPADGDATPYRLVWTRARVAEIPLSRTAASLAEQGYLVLGRALEPGAEPTVALLTEAFTPPAGAPADLLLHANLGHVLDLELTALSSELTASLHGRIDDLTEDLATAQAEAREGARMTAALEAYRASRGYRYATFLSRRLRPLLQRRPT
jgi:hypothetical protein